MSNLEMMKGKILLVVKDANNTTKYCHYLNKVINFDLVSSINKAYDSCLNNYYDLIIADLQLSTG